MRASLYFHKNSKSMKHSVVKKKCNVCVIDLTKTCLLSFDDDGFFLPAVRLADRIRSIKGKKLKIQIERRRLAMDEKTRDRRRGLREWWG